MTAAGALLAALLLAGTSPDGSRSAQERRAAEEQLQRGETRAAIERLRLAVAADPDDRALALLLARAYLAEGNLFWAERTLAGELARRPDDAGTRAWLACVHVRQGDPALVRADLDASHTPGGGPELGRWRLLDALGARLEGRDEDAARALASLAATRELYAEDRPVLARLRRQLDPGWLDPVSGSAELAVGYTSNALAGAPTDPGLSGAGTELGRLELRSRLAPGGSARIRPLLDLEVDGSGLDDREYRELSTLRGSARASGLLLTGSRRLLLGYRGEWLLLDRSPSLYSEAHRAEVELETAGGAMVFAGLGRRRYEDGRRTRREADVGLGGPLRLGAGAPLALGLTLRFSEADDRVYDQRGVSVAAAARVSLGRGFAARLVGSASLDDYPHSGGEAGRLLFGTGERRRDVLGRFSAGLWAPGWRGVRPGLEWQVTRRDSTADDTFGHDFDYRESRVTVLLQWRFAADPGSPRGVAPPGHVPLDWGLTDGPTDETERILDLLRQDEDLRRGSSCVVR